MNYLQKPYLSVNSIFYGNLDPLVLIMFNDLHLTLTSAEFFLTQISVY